MKTFKAVLQIIGINPYIAVPEKILRQVFIHAGRQKGYIPVRGLINGDRYTQTLVKFRGAWRLYINTTMLKNSPKRIGEIITISVEYDDADRTLAPHPKLIDALANNAKAAAVFNNLPPSRKKEIVRYIANLKTAESIDRNIEKAILFLLGKARFIGRDSP